MWTIGKSSYNAVETSLRYNGRRASLLASYTYSRSEDTGSTRGEALDPFDHELTWALSRFDLRHNFVVSYGYTLPFERWVGHPSRLLERLVDLWRHATDERLSDHAQRIG